MLTRTDQTQETATDEAATPFDGLYQMQRELFRLNLEATAKMSRCSMQFLGPTNLETLPSAPLQLFAFFNDCAKLSMAPVSMMAASALSPATQLIGGIARAAGQAEQKDD